ncbi:hypothetical protein F511_18319 [Dorcoceras hygrometricum]|uniref:Uncharacterized protein n=1 Tax=Dorcoceras hygrometricum TaxID=472368 RepID=A0A2Z7CMD6_9LAMI|nr:hypothetical protein F511_18319 [Dorcoceras hygrometricum]
MGYPGQARTKPRSKTHAGRTAAPSTADHRATCLRVVAGICATIVQEISSIGRPGAAHIHAHGRAKTSRTAATHGRPVRNNLRGQPLAKLLPSGLLARRRRQLLGLHAHPVATVFQDLMAIKKVQREQDAKLTALDNQVVAIRNEQLDFQSKIAADILSLSTQFGDIIDHIRGGDSKKGEIGSSSRRSPPIRVERRPLPTPANQGESSSVHGRVPSVEEAAEMI